MATEPESLLDAHDTEAMRRRQEGLVTFGDVEDLEQPPVELQPLTLTGGTGWCAPSP